MSKRLKKCVYAPKKKWDKAVGARFEKELTKLQRMNLQVAEYSVQRNYLDLFLDLPWNEFSEDKFDLKSTKDTRPRSFWFGGCQKANYRVLAVLKLRNDMKSPIFVFVWPPVLVRPH